MSYEKWGLFSFKLVGDTVYLFVGVPIYDGRCSLVGDGSRRLGLNCFIERVSFRLSMACSISTYCVDLKRVLPMGSPSPDYGGKAEAPRHRSPTGRKSFAPGRPATSCARKPEGTSTKLSGSSVTNFIVEFKWNQMPYPLPYCTKM